MQKDLPATNVALKQGHCVPCEGGATPLTEIEENNYHDATPNWEIARAGVHQLVREFVFKDFKETIAFINKIAEIANAEDHHPNLYLHDYKKLKVELYTHAIGGLSTNDFIVAAKINEIA